MRKSRLFFSLALVGALVAPSSAAAQTSLTPDTWFRFSWSDLGMISQSFLATTSTVRVVDCCIVGDMFSVYSDGVLVGSTSAVAADDGTSTGASTGDAAWADSRLSKGMFDVTAGSVITI